MWKDHYQRLKATMSNLWLLEVATDIRKNQESLKSPSMANWSAGVVTSNMEMGWNEGSDCIHSQGDSGHPSVNVNAQYHFGDDTRSNFLIIFFIVKLKSYLKYTKMEIWVWAETGCNISRKQGFSIKRMKRSGCWKTLMKSLRRKGTALRSVFEADSVTILGKVNDLYQIVTGNNQIYYIAEGEKGDEVINS